MKNSVTAVPAASSSSALAHFQSQFEYETDCWDTHEAMKEIEPGFVLLDVRSHELFDKGHIEGAVSLPHQKIIASKMKQWPADTLFVVYCAGPHCNGAAKAAINLAKLNCAVKLMAGGITGWLDEGFVLKAK